MSLKDVNILVSEKCFSIDDLHLKISWFYTGKLGGPVGLDSCHFQHRNESDSFVASSLFKKGVFLTWKRLG